MVRMRDGTNAMIVIIANERTAMDSVPHDLCRAMKTGRMAGTIGKLAGARPDRSGHHTRRSSAFVDEHDTVNERVSDPQSARSDLTA
jgi:hypothetical protein